MGIYDREYYQEERRLRFALPMGPEWRTSAVAWIIGLTLGTYFVQLILEALALPPVLACVPAKAVGEFQVWRLLTGAFCHGSFFDHLFFNMLCVFFFGPQIERLYGRRDFVWFYLTTAIIGNGAFTAVAYATGNTGVPVIGASGCCYALIVLSALYFPRQTVIFIFVPMPLWLLGVFLVLKDVVSVFSPQADPTVAYVVHLAGAATGLAYRFVDLRVGTFLARIARVGAGRRMHRVFREAPPTAADGIPRFVEDIEQQRMDRLLDKIHRFGRESLSAEELEFLDRMSIRYRRRS
jgi:membrane associated rhomboid family serine protease